MAKLRKRSTSHSTSPRSPKASVLNTDSITPLVLPVVNKQPGSDAQPWHHATKHERHRSENVVRDRFQTRQRVDVPKSDWTNTQSPTSPTAKIAQPVVTKAQGRPSPLRVSQEAPAVSEPVIAGSSGLAPSYPRERCGPSCQKCGRPRKPYSPNVPNHELARAHAVNWPLPGPGIEPVLSASKEPLEKASMPEAPQPRPTTVPSNDQRSKRRRYFSLPSKSKPSFKGPTELAPNKGNTVEPLSSTGSNEQRARPVSAPSPTKRPFSGPANIASPKPRPKAGAHVHFAIDDQLGRFAGHIRGPDTQSHTPSRALKSLTRGPASKAHSHQSGRELSSPAPNRSRGAPQMHPRALKAAQPCLRPNSAVLYEWPLITTLINQPNSNPRIRHRSSTHPPSRSSLSLSKRPSRRTIRPYSKTRLQAPIPPDHASSRRQSLLQQSHEPSSEIDHSSNGFRDSMSIQILDMLQGFPGGELAATAKTPTDTKSSSERPSLVRLQTYPPDPSNENSALDADANDDGFYGDVYSPSDYGTDDDENDDDDHPLPITPPQSDFSLASYSIGGDKKLSQRPTSALTQTSFSIGDDKHLSLNTGSVSAPSSVASSLGLATTESSPSALSTTLSPTHPLILTPGHPPRDSEGMIPISRLSFVDLPEVISSPSGDVDEEIDPDWFTWGSLPGSYGGAGMWSETSPLVSPGADVIGSPDCRAELLGTAAEHRCLAILENGHD